MRATFRIIETQAGPAVVRTEPSGYELVWEICSNKKHAAQRRTYHQHLEDQAVQRAARA